MSLGHSLKNKKNLKKTFEKNNVINILYHDFHILFIDYLSRFCDRKYL